MNKWEIVPEYVLFTYKAPKVVARTIRTAQSQYQTGDIPYLESVEWVRKNGKFRSGIVFLGDKTYYKSSEENIFVHHGNRRVNKRSSNNGMACLPKPFFIDD